MKAINDIKNEMAHIKKVLTFIEKETNGADFTVKDLYDRKGGYIMSGPLMKSLLRRNLVEIVGTTPSAYKAEIRHHNQWVEVTIPTTVNVYRQIHDYEWYKNVMLKTLTNIIESV